MPDDIIPIVAIIATFGVPLVWILTAHQRKMAELIHRTHQPQQPVPQNDSVSQEVRELKQLVYQQAIALDSLTSEVRKALPQTGAQETLPNRLSQD